MNKNNYNPSDFYEFDDINKEVTFKRHDTPSPWMNYLSNGTFHTMLSQAGGGVAFYKSPQIWRITRYRFFHLPTDRSGPYIYLQDAESMKYWCPTYEPAGCKPQEWKSAHGAGYTRFHAKEDKLEAITTYFVGPYENSLIWNLKLKNESAKKKEINVYAYVEFGMMEFMRELQWQCYNKHQVSVWYNKAGALIYKYGVENQPKPEETPLVYFAADHLPIGFDGDRDEFIGSYRSESNPLAVEKGGCTGSTVFGGDPCGALQFRLVLNPGEEKTLNVFLGTGMTEADIESSIKRSRETDFVQSSYKELQNNWHNYLNQFICHIPDADAQRMVNLWNPYQAQRNFTFSRNISYYATGTFRGVGFRDTAQDILAIIPLDIEAAKVKVKLLLTQQYQDGHVNHYFFPTEGWEPVKTIHSDDHLWTVLAVADIITEEGDIPFLEEKVKYFDSGEGTVYEHLYKAISFTEAHMGENGFPLMLRSDWNDALFRVCKEGRGESIWTAMQFGAVLLKMIELAKHFGKQQDIPHFDCLYKVQQKLVNTRGWDGKWFRRAIMDNGMMLGTEKNEEAQIWLNTQTWAVISQMTDEKKALQAMNSVGEILDTDLGIKKLYPPITTFPDPKEPLTNYNKGTGENGAVFCHANTWAIIAECMLGRGDRAYKYYRQLIPSVAMEKAGLWRYKAEPYVYSSNLFGPESDKFGLANVSWLTGTAAWMYIAATQYILGIKPVWEGLKIDPCLPSDWKEIKIEREYRGCRYFIEIVNKSGSKKGFKHMKVDGENVGENVVLHVKGRTECRVSLVLDG